MLFRSPPRPPPLVEVVVVDLIFGPLVLDSQEGVAGQTVRYMQF